MAATPSFAQSFEAWSAKAQKAQKAGDDVVAAEYWTDALRAWEAKDGKARRAKALSERAALYEKAGETDGALADLTAALKLDKKNAALFDRRGQLLFSQGKTAEAISDFYSATKVSISFGPAFYHRALAYEQQGDAGFAKEDFRTACRLGVKDACARAKGKTAAELEAAKAAKEAKAAKAAAPKAKAKAKASAPEAAPEAKKPQKQPLGKTVTPAPVKKVAKADMEACRESLQSCSDEGRGIDLCVRDAKVCEKAPGKGCCPEACVREFRRLQNTDRSDADLFRNVFTADADCAKGSGVNP